MATDIMSHRIYMDDERAYIDVQAERVIQHRKWGEQNHEPLGWVSILTEETGEVAKACNEGYFGHNEDTNPYADYRAELVQNAAVAIAAISSYDRWQARLEDKRIADESVLQPD